MRKKIKKKSFYFEDYNEEKLVNNPKDKKFIKISPNRVTFIFFIFLSLLLIFSIKITYLSLSFDKNLYAENTKEILINERRNIVDRNGSILATNVNLYDIGVKPILLNKQEKKNLLIKLGILFPELDLEEIKNKLDKKSFFWLGRRLTPKQKDQFWLMGNKAFEFVPRVARIYPQKNLFSHVLGQTDDTNTGISGLEKFLEKEINNKNKKKIPLKLTLDSNLQHVIRQELIRSKLNFNNIGSAAILMNVENGEILSLISLPDYDLNKRISINENIYTNKITLGVYEMGSVFKTFTVAAAIENQLVNSKTLFNNLSSSLNCDKYTINEHDDLPKNLSVEQILIRSSNIGAVRIAQKVGIEKYKDFLNSLELLKKVNFELEEVGTPLNFKWGKCKLATASYGHGITTTPLQLAKAYAILGNGGYKINPSI